MYTLLYLLHIKLLHTVSSYGIFNVGFQKHKNAHINNQDYEYRLFLTDSR